MIALLASACCLDPQGSDFRAVVKLRVLDLCLSTPVPTLMRDATLVIFMLLFACRTSAITGLRDSDVKATDWQATAVLIHRKGKRTQDPLVLPYDRNSAVDLPISSLALLSRWSCMRSTTDVFFALAEGDGLSASSTMYSVTALMSALNLSVSAGCAYSSHSARIGTYNEWLALSFPTPWIMHRMRWESDGMLRIYYDPRITVTDDSGWFSIKCARAYDLTSVTGPGRSWARYLWPFVLCKLCLYK
jgi:integrase